MDRVEYPDRMIFDLDPPEDDFAPVRRGAWLLKSLLDDLGLVSYVKTTGSHGLHVVVPLDRSQNFDEVRSFAREVAAVMTQREPAVYTIEQRKAKRQGRLFIDILRNTYGHTAVAPYAVRDRQGAPVAAPLFWEELKEKKLTARTYNLRNIFKRLKKTGDPWQDIALHPQSLAEPRLKLEDLRKSSQP
jgi:bifunctional non-homologous end joining protein LigD